MKRWRVIVIEFRNVMFLFEPFLVKICEISSQLSPVTRYIRHEFIAIQRKPAVQHDTPECRRGSTLFFSARCYIKFLGEFQVKYCDGGRPLYSRTHWNRWGENVPQVMSNWLPAFCRWCASVVETATFLLLTYYVTAQAINKPVSSWLTASRWSDSPSLPSGFPPGSHQVVFFAFFSWWFLFCYIYSGGGIWVRLSCFHAEGNCSIWVWSSDFQRLTLLDAKLIQQINFSWYNVNAVSGRPPVHDVAAKFIGRRKQAPADLHTFRPPSAPKELLKAFKRMIFRKCLEHSTLDKK